MEKKYKSAYVLMKAMPFHNGHKFLIDTAVTNSEKVTVVVGTLPTEPIPGEIRYKWVKEQYRTNPNVTVVHCSEVLPQYPEEHPDFWDIWVDVVKRYCPADIDVIFTSESYGEPYAQYLGIKHHMVDIDRRIVPVSGTLVRQDPFAMWYYLPDHVKPYFVKRIAVMGAESCGKSTLTKELAKVYNTVYVEEYGRTVWEEGEGVTEIDFIDIAAGHKLLEDTLVKQANKLMFADTEILTTQLFFEMYHPNGSKNVKEYLNYVEDKAKPYDLYILLKPDCDAVQDGTRQFLDGRLEHYNKIKEVLIEKGREFVEVGGSWANRHMEARTAIKNKFGW
jgi:HTH-type transcriptional repressor of NAD biosynthesis genes